MPSWRRHRKHLLLLSNAGKPIYSRYGDAFRLASFAGIVQAIISFVENEGDKIRTITAGRHQVRFCDDVSEGAADGMLTSASPGGEWCGRLCSWCGVLCTWSAFPPQGSPSAPSETSWGCCMGRWEGGGGGAYLPRQR